MRASVDDLAARLPPGIGDLAFSLEGWRINRRRYGRGYDAIADDVDRRLALGEEELRAWRDARLHVFLDHAFTTVPHYRDLAAEHGIGPGDIRNIDQLSALPLLRKHSLQGAPTDFVSSNAPKRRVVVHTSGTTGSGLHFTSTAAALAEQWAVWWRYRALHGINREMWCAYFGGRLVVDLQRQHGPFWRHDYAGRRTLFSTYHLSEETALTYMSELRRRRPPWFHGYPSALALLASYALDGGQDLGYVPSVITIGAENLTEAQSSVIKLAFGRVPVQHYGLAEAVANASQCLAGELHIDEDFAVVEVVPNDTGALELVGTNLSNPATPLIRYATGDVVAGLRERCDCGLPGRVIVAVDGRQEDYLVLADGRRLGRLDHIFKDLLGIHEAQFTQSHPGHAVLRIVPRQNFDPAARDRLDQELYRFLGRDAQVEIELVQQIPRSSAGKLRLVVTA